MSTAYVSGRIPARYERLVARQARGAKTSKSDLVARYVVEKSLETEFPGTEHEMVTVITQDGADLALTHYCMLGNQPQQFDAGVACAANIADFDHKVDPRTCRGRVPCGHPVHVKKAARGRPLAL